MSQTLPLHYTQHDFSPRLQVCACWVYLDQKREKKKKNLGVMADDGHFPAINQSKLGIFLN